MSAHKLIQRAADATDGVWVFCGVQATENGWESRLIARYVVCPCGNKRRALCGESFTCKCGETTEGKLHRTVIKIAPEVFRPEGLVTFFRELLERDPCELPETVEVAFP